MADSLRESATLPPATVYRQFGIDTKHTFVASGNRPITVLNHGAPIEELV